MLYFVTTKTIDALRTFTFDKRKYGFELLMDLHTFEDNPGLFFEPLPHTTDFFEIFIFEQGSGQIDLNGHLLEIRERSAFFISPFQKKSCRIDPRRVKGFHLVFQQDFLSEFFDDKLFAFRMQYFHNARHPQYLQMGKQDYQNLKFAFREIIEELKGYQNDSEHIIRALLYFALSKLNRLYSRQYAISNATQSNAVTYQFKEALEQHIRCRHTVQEYCTLLGVSRHQLNALAKAHFGITSKAVIANRLLQEVKAELRYTDKTIAEIAFDLHFSEANNLTRFFTARMGYSPVAYRAQLPK